MIRPVNHNLSIIRRSSFDDALRLYEYKGGPTIDISNTQLLSQLWDRSRTERFASFEIDTTDANVGLIVLKLSANNTISLPNAGVYDVKVIYPDNEEYYLVQGNFIVKEGYTDD